MSLEKAVCKVKKIVNLKCVVHMYCYIHSFFGSIEGWNWTICFISCPPSMSSNWSSLALPAEAAICFFAALIRTPKCIVYHIDHATSKLTRGLHEFVKLFLNHGWASDFFICEVMMLLITKKSFASFYLLIKTLSLLALDLAKYDFCSRQHWNQFFDCFIVKYINCIVRGHYYESYLLVNM